MATLNELWFLAAASMGIDVTGMTLNEAQIAALNVIIANGQTYAPLNSPHFTGVPTVPTASPGTNTTQAASTAFVKAAVDAGGGSSLDDFAVNPFVNGDFTVAQTGTSFVIATGPAQYTVDQVLGIQGGNSTVTVSIVPVAPGDGWPSGVTEVLQWDINQPAADQNGLWFRIENAAALGLAQRTFSIYGKVNSGTITPVATLVQDFGTGGSPSADVTATIGNVPLTTTIQRLSLPYTPGATAAKTFGTATPRDDYVDYRLTTPLAVGSVTKTIQLACLRDNVGASAAPLALLDPALAQNRCGQYFQRKKLSLAADGVGAIALQGFTLDPEMRDTPAVTLDADCTQTNLSSIALDEITVNGFRCFIQSSAAVGYVTNGFALANARIAT